MASISAVSEYIVFVSYLELYYFEMISVRSIVSYAKPMDDHVFLPGVKVS